MKKSTKKILHVLHYYMLAIVVLLGYYIAELLDIISWAFEQNFIIMIVVLTLWYGTILWIADSIIHKWWKI